MVLSHVMLSSRPGATVDGGGWPFLAGRTWDVRHEPRDGRTGWSLACHVTGDERVGPETVGWIHRWAGRGYGALEGVLVFDTHPRPRREPLTGRTVWYCDGHIRRLGTPIDGHSIVDHSDWSGAAPYHSGRARQFQCGRRVADADAAVLRELLEDDERWHLDRMRDAVARRRAPARRGLRRPT